MTNSWAQSLPSNMPILYPTMGNNQKSEIEILKLYIEKILKMKNIPSNGSVYTDYDAVTKSSNKSPKWQIIIYHQIKDSREGNEIDTDSSTSYF